MVKNRIKEEIFQGRAVAGVVMAESSVETLEVLALSGFDFIFIDCEHGPMSVESVSRMVMAAELRGVTTLVRNPLQHGERRVAVPGHRGRRDHHPGAGFRPDRPGGGELRQIRSGGLPRPGRGAGGRLRAGTPLAEYVKIANRETMVLGVVESKKGVENIREILEVDGLDGVFMGTNDLANSLGLTGQTSHPDVLRAVDMIVEAGKATGKAIGGVVRAGETPQQYIDKGCKMVLTASHALLAGAAKGFLSKIENRNV